MSLVPMVVEQTGAGERSYDIFSRLLNDRIVMLCDQVNDATASLVIAQMLYLEGKDPDKDIYFYINSKMHHSELFPHGAFYYFYFMKRSHLLPQLTQ